jgi:hypothetical protein
MIAAIETKNEQTVLDAVLARAFAGCDVETDERAIRLRAFIAGELARNSQNTGDLEAEIEEAIAYMEDAVAWIEARRMELVEMSLGV